MINSIAYDRVLNKIVMDPEVLGNRISSEYPGRTVVLVKGVYDLFHVGHFYSFINARKFGDTLVVAVNSDIAVRQRKGVARPIISQENRMLLISALDCVDWVTLYNETSPFQLLTQLKPSVFAASHFESLSDSERAQIQTVVKLQLLPKIGAISTSQIIAKIRGEE